MVEEDPLHASKSMSLKESTEVFESDTALSERLATIGIDAPIETGCGDSVQQGNVIESYTKGGLSM